MTSGFDELSLAIFTSLAPAGVIAFIIMALARLGCTHHETAVRLDRMIALPYALVLLGFIASATHLGTPANALHVFSGIGRSSLSNEVLSAVVFLLLGGSYWMAAFKLHFSDKLAKPWLALACLAGIILIGATAFVYSIHTVPTWNTLHTPASLIASALLGGCILGLLFLKLTFALHRKVALCLLGFAFVAFAANIALHFSFEVTLNGISNNEFSAHSLAPHFSALIVLFAAMVLSGIGLCIYSLRTKVIPTYAHLLRAIGSLIVLSAIFLTRMEFYNLYMTVGF